MSDVDHFESDIATSQEANGPPSVQVADGLLIARRVAALLGRTRRTLRNWERRGWLRPVRSGRGAFYRPSDLEALSEHGAPTPASIPVSVSAPAAGAFRTGADDTKTSRANQSVPALSGDMTERFLKSR
jgi:hypothetical protein